MTVQGATDIRLSHLNRADGSATYSHGGYTVVGAVNGPVEVQRRDELPEEATIEVTVRPAVGVGGKLYLSLFTNLHLFQQYIKSSIVHKLIQENCTGVGERHFESIIQATLRHVILVRSFPRSLIQVVLQVVETPVDDYDHRGKNYWNVDC